MFKRTWDNDLTPGQRQELSDAEGYVKAFGDGNSYASHMILMARLAKIADVLQGKLDKYDVLFEGSNTGHS